MRACACFAATSDIEMVRDADGKIPLEEFIDLRARCMALREILVPDEIWPAFLEWHRTGDDVASHSSVVLLAYRRGYLPKVTGPVHRYLLTETGVSPNARKQYVKDLREKWMLDPDPGERHRLSRIFRGRLIELQYAEWLEAQNYSMTGMEAIRRGPDIEARSKVGEASSYEVKFFGMEDGDFQILLKSMSGGAAGGAISVYQPLNYLVFRVYQAAVQLASAAGERVVVIVIDGLAWFRFDMQVRGGWINWSTAAFNQVDEAWKTFMDAQPKGWPSTTELREAIKQVNRVKIYQQNAAFEFALELDAKVS
jgi:hypothetical protein